MLFWSFGFINWCDSTTEQAEETALRLNGMIKSCMQQVNVFFLSRWVIYFLVLKILAYLVISWTCVFLSCFRKCCEVIHYFRFIILEIARAYAGDGEVPALVKQCLAP